MSSPSRASRLGLFAFFLVWLLVLAVPLSRAVWQFQLAGLSHSDQIVGGGFPEKTLLQRFPDDVQIAAVAAAHTSPYGSNYQPGTSEKNLKLIDVTRPYDEVIARHPHEVWLYANWLTRATLFGIIPPAKQDDRSVRSSLNFRQLTPEELQRFLQIATQGAQLDPQNSFYAWMRAAALFGLNRDTAALDALKAGAAKPRYDDGSRAAASAQLHVFDLAGYPLYEERLSAALSDDYHQLSVIRSVGEVAALQALQARQRGDWTQAWRIYDDLQHMGAVMQQGAASLGDVYTAQRVLQRFVWRSAVVGKTTFEEAKPLDAGTPQPKRITAPDFALFARQHGRADLADFALRTYQAFDGQRIYERNAKFLFSGVSNADGQATMRANGIGELLLRILIPCLGLWLVLGTALWWRGPRVASLSRLDVAASIGFCLPLLLLGLAYTWYWQDKMILENFFGGEEDRFQAVADYKIVQQHIELLRAVLPWGVPILGAVYALSASWWRQRVLRQEEGDEVDAYVLAPRPRWATLLLGVAGYLFTIALVYGFMTSVLNWPNESSSDIGIYVCALLAAPLMLMLRWLGGRLQFSVKTASLRWRAVEWQWRTLGAFTLLVSMVYAGLTWSTLPARTRADDSFNRCVQQGEVPYMRQLMEGSTHTGTAAE